jgi:hypothetical protein
VAVDVDISEILGEGVQGRVSRNGFVSQKRRPAGRIGRNAPAVIEKPSVRTPPSWIGFERTRLLPLSLEEVAMAQSRVGPDEPGDYLCVAIQA